MTSLGQGSKVFATFSAECVYIKHLTTINIDFTKLYFY